VPGRQPDQIWPAPSNAGCHRCRICHSLACMSSRSSKKAQLKTCILNYAWYSHHSILRNNCHNTRNTHPPNITIRVSAIRHNLPTLYIRAGYVNEKVPGKQQQPGCEADINQGSVGLRTHWPRLHWQSKKHANPGTQIVHITAAVASRCCCCLGSQHTGLSQKADDTHGQQETCTASSVNTVQSSRFQTAPAHMRELPAGESDSPHVIGKK
jgi:hypothetical protein